MAGKTLFTDQQVREIKANLVLGVPCSALARRWGCGEETIGRIKRGLTYRHVRVLGEEKLRPEVALVAPTKEMMEIQSGVTDEEIAESEAALLALLKQDVGKEKQVTGALTEVEQLAQSMLGNTPISRG